MSCCLQKAGTRCLGWGRLLVLGIGCWGGRTDLGGRRPVPELALVPHPELPLGEREVGPLVSKSWI